MNVHKQTGVRVNFTRFNFVFSIFSWRNKLHCTPACETAMLHCASSDENEAWRHPSLKIKYGFPPPLFSHSALQNCSPRQPVSERGSQRSAARGEASACLRARSTPDGRLRLGPIASREDHTLTERIAWALHFWSFTSAYIKTKNSILSTVFVTVTPGEKTVRKKRADVADAKC